MDLNNVFQNVEYVAFVINLNLSNSLILLKRDRFFCINRIKRSTINSKFIYEYGPIKVLPQDGYGKIITLEWDQMINKISTKYPVLTNDKLRDLLSRDTMAKDIRRYCHHLNKLSDSYEHA